MPTAHFQADFTQWNAALKGAQEKLKSFEVAAGNVGPQLKRAFSAVSGEKLIRDANLAVAAVDKLGGAAKLTASEQAKLNATLTEALAKYKALGQVAPKEMQDLANATKQVVAPTEAATASVGALALKYVSIGAAIALATKAIGGLVDFLSSSVASYAQAEAAQNRMVAALRAQGTATPAVIKQYTELAATIQRTTAFSDDAAAEMISLFTAIGNVAPAEMGKATKAAADLAAGLGIDLVQAATLVAKAMEGNTGALGRYGIQIDKAKVAAEGADAIFGAINERFGGQSAAQLDTYAGRLAQITNLWDDFKEAVGQAIVEDESIQQLMKEAPAIIQGMTTAIGLFAEGIRQAHDAWRDFQNAISFGAFGAKEQFLEMRDAAREAKIAMDLLGRETPMAGTFRDVELKAPEIPAILPKGLQAGETIEGIDAALRKMTVSLIASSKAAEEAAKNQKELYDTLSGANAVAILSVLIAAWEQMPPALRESAAAQDRFLDEYVKLAPALVKVPPRLAATVAGLNKLALAAGKFSADKIIDGLKSLEGIGTEVHDTFTNVFADLLEFETKVTATSQNIAEVVNAAFKIDERTESNFLNTVLDLQDRLTVINKTGLDRQLAELQVSKARELVALKANHQLTVAEYEKLAAQIEAIYDRLAKELKPDFGTKLTKNLQEALGTIPQIITDALIHGADFEDIAAAIGTQIGAAIGGAIGFALGGPLGEKIGGALGSLLGPLLDSLIQTRAEETQVRISEEFGVAISEGLAQAIEDAAADFGGDRQAAKLFNLDRIIAEGGGLSSANVDVMLARLHDVFSAIETGAFTTEQAMDVLDKNFGEFAAFVTRDGALASQALLDIIRLNKEFGTSSKAVAEFVTANVTSAIGGLTQFLENAEVTSQAAAEGIAASVFGAFEALTQQGASPLDAIKQLTPVLEQLDAQLKAAGFSGGAAFDQIRAMAALANDAVRGPMIEAITGLGTALEGLHNSGVLNQEMFAGLSTQITDTYNKLIAQGTDGAQALALVGPSIQTLWELQQDFGYAVDEATQKLIDQGIEAGVVGDEHRSAQEQMAIAMDRTADAVEYLAEQFGYVAEEAKKSAEAINKIPEKVNIRVNYDVERLPDAGFGGEPNRSTGERPEYFETGGPVYAQHGMFVPRGTDTVPAMLTPGEVVLPRDLVATLRANASAPSTTVHLTIQTIDGADVERVVRSAEFRRALTSSIAGNVGGIRTDIRAGIGVR